MDEPFYLVTTEYVPGAVSQLICGCVFGVGTSQSTLEHSPPRLTGPSPTERLREARGRALQQLHEAAVRTGANGVIGLRLEIAASGPVTHLQAYGTAVRVEMEREVADKLSAAKRPIGFSPSWIDGDAAETDAPEA